MAKQKYTFPGPCCPSCQYHQAVGNGLIQTRYCGGFPKNRKPKRFKRSDPKYKPPKWCPRLISPPVCRIYGFIDQENKFADWLFNRKDHETKKELHISALERRYTLRLTTAPNMSAKQFFDEAQLLGVHRVLPDAGVTAGEVIEIDDGLKPYYFYCLDGSTVIPLLSFDRSRAQPAKGSSEG